MKTKIKSTDFTLILMSYFLIALLGLIYCGQNSSANGPIPADTRQMIVVITEAFDSSAASLFQYQRPGIGGKWETYGEKISAIVGKNGLGWGLGLHSILKNTGPIKREGDGRSPAGVFHLISVFGFIPPQEMKQLKMPYQHIRELVECVDDPNSDYYNTIIHRNQANQVDWQSSERMWRAKLWYELGVVVGHNKNPTKKNAGSCIFLHYWANPKDSTSGCTAMSPEDMKDIVNWLDRSKNPLLVQLPRPVYNQYQVGWDLPLIPNKVKPSPTVVEKDTPKLSGISFRAVGNEPGWVLEITEGKKLILSTNYGRESYEFEMPQSRIDDESGKTVYQTEEKGNSLTVIIENRACTDTMNGLGFENTVTVVINGQKLVGCGRALH